MNFINYNMHFKTIIFVTGVMMGIVGGEVSVFSSEIAVCAMLLVVTQATLHTVKRREKREESGDGKNKVFSVALFTAIFSLGIFLGILRVQMVEEKVPFVCAEACTFNAEIISSSDSKDAYQTFNVSNLDSVSSSNLDIQIKASLYPKYKIGDTLKLSGKVSVPETLAPHAEKKSFDYNSYLLTKNVGSEMYYPKIELVDEDAHSVSATLGRWKENMSEKINLYVASPASSLASGMLFGNSSMSKELNQTFRVAGLSHIIVLSGFNIAIVISFILFVFAFLPLLLRVSIASVSVILFVIMVGGEASVIRATLMAFIALLATVIGREYIAKQALVISLLLIVLYEPYSLLHDVSLHLSFLATAGIVYLSKLIEIIFKKYLTKVTSDTFIALMVTTLSAYVATLPYIMYTFGAVSVYALIANVLVLPFVPTAMLLSFVVVSSAYALPVLASVFGFVDSAIIGLMIYIASVIEGLPFSYLSLRITFGMMCFLYVILISVIYYLLVRKNNETGSTSIDGILTDTISY